MFTDSHCHLNFPELMSQMEHIRLEMQQASVTRALCISTTMENFPQVYALAQQYDNFWATVGVHPDEEDVLEPSAQDLIERARWNKVLAIGETGLDYYQMQERKGGRTRAEMEWQRARFRTHIEAARAVAKPLVIHTRAASEDTIAILREAGASADYAGGVFHCFTESTEVARQALDMGYYISFSGIVTFKSAHELRETVAYVPMDRTLIETDSPYLAPVPFRGKVNTPAFVPWVAKEIARIKNLSVEEVAHISSQNFDALFKPDAN